ncbi:MAG: RICIN domain-containing protein [Bdellovibrio sp.]|nr:RICIN domain-containing protein [Bdellovibrio sp.]
MLRTNFLAAFLSFTLSLILNGMSAPLAHADLRAKGPLDMSCTLYGTAGGTAVDFGKLALDVYSLYSGTSSIYDGLFGAGVVPAGLIRSQGGVSIAQSITNFIAAFSDKNCFASGKQRLSKEAREPLRLNFEVKSTQRSYDDFDPSGWFAHTDPIGTLEVAVGQYDGITTRVVGKGTKEGYISVTLDPKKLDVGFYPITFYAKEDSCNECLKIVHVAVVQVYQPCPPRANVCDVAIEGAQSAWDQYKEVYRILFGPMITRSVNCQLRVDQFGGACNQLSRHANGNYPNSDRRDEAQRRADQCLDRFDQIITDTRGHCPEILLCASQQDCALKREPFSNRQLTEAYGLFSQKVAEIKRLNCCSEAYNPRGGSGPNPALVTTNVSYTITERSGVDTYSRTVEQASLFNYTENNGVPTLRSKITIVKGNGRMLINGKPFDSLNFNFMVKDPLRRSLRLGAAWLQNNPALSRPYFSNPQWINNRMESFAQMLANPSVLPLGITTLNFSVVLPNPTDNSLNVSVQHLIDVEVKAEFTDGGNSGPSDVRPLYGLGGKCLTHYGWNPAPGTPLLLWDCVSQVNQFWKLTNDGKLIGNGGQCVEVKGNATASGSEIVINPCNNSANQKWRLDKGLMVHSSGKCLNVKGAQTQNGTPIILWDCGNYANEKWSWMKPMIVLPGVINLQ